MSNGTEKAKNSVIVIVLLAVIGAGAGGVYLADQLYYKPMREQKQLVENLKTILDKLTKDVRIAEVTVVKQSIDPPKTTIRFQEVDEKENPIGSAREIEMAGNEVYFDTFVIKFEDNFKPLDDERLKQKNAGTELVGKSIIIFRRVFSDKQQPEKGETIDKEGQEPLAYAGNHAPDKLERELWQDFWKLANDPDLAKARGVRAAHGEAVSMKVAPDKVYIIEKRASGDLTIRPEKIRSVLRKP
jgi:hypothetical protein